ncbi:MAG: ABC transporter permease [Candidatus Lokiarchaeota archaeon]|nr:ABC transporter permease [Candidatus Lokiarchaeota archaeon]
MVKSKNMLMYIVKRLIIMVVMVFFVLVATFFLTHLMEVNPVLNKMSSDPRVPYEVYLQERDRVGADKPLYEQFVIYITNFFQGNWGTSYIVADGVPVTTLITIIFPKTIELVIIPIIIIPFLSVKLGINSAKHRNKWQDNIIRGVIMLGVCIPIFFLATLIQYFVSHILNVYTYGVINFETQSGNSITIDYDNRLTGFRLIDAFLFNDQALLHDTLLHLFLPSVASIVVSLAGITRQTRASMLDVMRKDYVRTARAKGVAEKDVINKHALRNALIPTSNEIVGLVASLLIGSLFLEIIFNYKGMGWYLFAAIQGGDYVVITGIIVIDSIIIISGTLVADVLYTLIDPRIVYT